MVRDRLTEIAAVQSRSKWRYWRGKSEYEALVKQWDEGRIPFKVPPAFVVIRLVTILEVFTRHWVAELVDLGEPYTTRSTEAIKGSLKIDFALAQALAGNTITLGELIAHDIPVNGIGDIDRIFSLLLGAPLFRHLRDIVDRFEVEVEGKQPFPIMPNPDRARSALARLFEMRHIFVHELPDNQHLDGAVIGDGVRATGQFLRAANQAFSTLLHPGYPVTQAQANSHASAIALKADTELDAVLDTIDPERADTLLWEAQGAWKTYRHLHSDYRSGLSNRTDGSIAPMQYYFEFGAITRDRIEQLRRMTSNRDDG